MSVKTEKFLIKLSEFFIFLILLLPLIRFHSRYFPALRTLIFEVLAAFLFLIYLYLSLYNPKYRPKFSWLNLAVLIFIVSSLISLIFGVNPPKSFFGTLERMGGFWTLFHYAIFFFILSYLFAKEKENNWRRIFNWVIFIGVIVAFWGLGQKIGLDIYFNNSERISGPIGNPIFFAAYLIFPLFYTLIFFFRSKNIKSKLFYSFILAIFFLAILFSGSRGVLISLILGFFIFGLLYAFLSFDLKKKKTALVFSFLILAIFSFLFFAREKEFVKNNFYLSRLSLSSVSDLRNRFLAWDISFQAFKERPLFGWGEENFKIAFNKYFSPVYFETLKSEVFFDRAHSVIFDRLIAGGIFGFASYLFIFFALYLTIFKLKKEKKLDAANFSILFVLPLVYFLQNLSAFDTFPTYSMFFLFLAFINSNYFFEIKHKESLKFSNDGMRPIFKILFLFFSILTLFFMYEFSFKPLFALSYYFKSQRTNSLSQAQDFYKKFASFNTFGNAEISEHFSLRLFQNVTENVVKDKSAKEKYLLGAKEAMLKAAEIEPYNSDFWLRLAGIQLVLREVDENASLEEAEIYLKKVLELSPNNLLAILDFAEVRRLQGKLNEFLEISKKGVELNLESAVAHFYLGSAYLSLSKNEEAEKEFDKARSLGYKEDIRDLKYVAGIYRKLGNWQKVAEFYEEIIKKDSSNPDFYLRLAEAYYNLGELGKAEKIISTYPH